MLLDIPANEKSRNNMPLYLLSVIALTVLVVSFIKTAAAIKITYIINRLLFLLTGCIGLLLLFLWFGTDHTAFKGNYNLLWAIPLNIFPAFMPSWKAVWLKKYFRLSSILYGLLIISWYWLPQQLNIALIPLFLLLLSTTVRLSKK